MDFFEGILQTKPKTTRNMDLLSYEPIYLNRKFRYVNSPQFPALSTGKILKPKEDPRVTMLRYFPKEAIKCIETMVDQRVLQGLNQEIGDKFEQFTKNVEIFQFRIIDELEVINQQKYADIEARIQDISKSLDKGVVYTHQYYEMHPH